MIEHIQAVRDFLDELIIVWPHISSMLSAALDFWITIVFVCSIVAATTQTPDRRRKNKHKAYKVIDFLALNIWKAKDRGFREG